MTLTPTPANARPAPPTRPAARTRAARTRAALTGRAAKAAAVVVAAALIALAGAALAAHPGRHAAKAPAAAGAGQENCIAYPHTCGYPDATNTGVPATAVLKTVPGQVSSGPGWAYEKAGYVKVYGDGANLSDLFIPYNLDITASNVTIDDVKVATTGTGSFGISLRHTSDVTIENSDIYSPPGGDRLQYGIDDVYADSAGTLIKANQIYGTANGIQINEGTITGNYIYDMKADPADHVDGLLSTSGSTPANPLTVSGNTILNSVDQTSDIALYQDFGPQGNATIKNNLLAGGGYSIYGGDSGPATPTDIVITGNRFSTLYYPNGGYYGPAAYTATGTGDVWSGNIWDKTLQTVNP